MRIPDKTADAAATVILAFKEGSDDAAQLWKSFHPSVRDGYRALVRAVVNVATIEPVNTAPVKGLVLVERAATGEWLWAERWPGPERKDTFIQPITGLTFKVERWMPLPSLPPGYPPVMQTLSG